MYFQYIYTYYYAIFKEGEIFFFYLYPSEFLLLTCCSRLHTVDQDCFKDSQNLTRKTPEQRTSIHGTRKYM